MQNYRWYIFLPVLYQSRNNGRTTNSGKLSAIYNTNTPGRQKQNQAHDVKRCRFH